MKALILNIGDEILSGKTVNTNSSFIALELSKLSISVEKVVVVKDDYEAIRNEIIQFKNSDFDLLFTTGGLGPTHDDLTKETIVETLGLKMEIDQNSKAKIDKYFNNSAPKSNYKQAYFPKEALIIENKLGTANGAIISFEGKHYFILVGPPYELKPMVERDCLEYLRTLQNEVTLYREYIVMGGGESFFEDLLDALISSLKNVHLTPYASVGKIRYLVTAKDKYEQEFSRVVNEFEDLMASYIISKDNKEVEEVLFDLLSKYDYKISFGESLTGGMLASTFINVPGASKYLKESFITYSNEAKIKYLDVKESTISKYGEVSGEVAHEMVVGLANKTNVEVALSITGFAGPSGIEDKIGLVYYGIKIKSKIYIIMNKFKGNREIVRTRACLYGLYKLVSLLKKQ